MIIGIMRFSMILLAGMSNMLSHLGDQVAYEIVRAVDLGAVKARDIVYCCNIVDVALSCRP